MKAPSPPRWLEHALTFFVGSRDRETISGDLLEEYREDRLPRLGPLRANFWYLRQTLGFAGFRISGGRYLKQLLTLLCLFAMAAGTWLAVMENILKHDGYTSRTVMAICIAVQGLMTLTLSNRPPVWRGVIMGGAIALGIQGALALIRISRAPHFEGFVLVIGAALVLQSVLTLAVFSGKPAR